MNAITPIGHVDVEDPVPREVVDEEAAEQRPDHGRDAEDAAHQPRVAPAVARRDDVADRGLRADHQRAAAEALDRAEEDQRRHAAGESAEDRSEQEDDEGHLEHELAAEEVAELARQRRAHGRREHVGGDDPGELRRAAEVADDGRAAPSTRSSGRATPSA